MRLLLVESGARVPLESGSPDGSKSYSLHSAASDGDVETLQLLLQQADGQACLGCFDDDFGDTPVGTAARFGHIEALRLLLEFGGDPNLCDPAKIAQTPLSSAAATSLEAVKLLLDYGANPDLAWGLCETGREVILRRGGAMAQLLVKPNLS